MISPETFVFLGSHMCLWAWNTDYGVLKGPRSAHSWLRISLISIGVCWSGIRITEYRVTVCTPYSVSEAFRNP